MSELKEPADRYLAKSLRQQVQDLRQYIIDLRAAGLTVEVPELAHLFFDGGTATGSPAEWKIYREH